MQILKLFLLVCLLWLTGTHAAAQDMSSYSRESFSRKGKTLQYRLLTPANYNIQQKYPLVIFLHGAGERGWDNNAQLLHGGELFLRDTIRERYPAFVLFPQCPGNETWAPMKMVRDSTGKVIRADFPLDVPAPAPTQLLTQLLDSLLATGKVDPKRVYIGGLSLGGMGTFYLITRYPRLFAAAFPICGAGNTDAAGDFAGKVPVWMFHGGADMTVPVEASRAYNIRLKALKAAPKYTEYPGVGHNSWDSAFVEPDLMRWIFSHKKK
ncbi:alpha/beta hydrolase-fold protein [Chitinophaga nivalis]|uniref:Alpha/beta hydrolase-fold protein n=1 Tax=Chitinophaga nivalis TaxID=2991709 RepID=A0ABT3IG12_9BACT|nr:alpha/beta hydrolase-fold protein [Chitinophaga nivalis]MCW3467410.1 alpha/beta hydrolase-fold protein [Chitinophaga nivalis]MCW3482898.1 alpha/beta hydrolase-fold protein [Chitinophaga nivalis]